MKIIITGDICPSHSNVQAFSSGDEEYLFNDVVGLLQTADLSIFNLESPITDAQNKIEKIGPCFKAPVESAKTMAKAGLTVAGLANNHIRDYGDKGVLDTIQYCQEAGIRTVGAGKNTSEAQKGLIVKIDRYIVGILAFSDQEFSCATEKNAGANPFDALDSIDAIRNFKKQCDYLVILYHSGIENYQYQTPDLQKRCRKMVDAGANAVVCQHSHCIGTYECYAGAHIIYGQGNCLFESKSRRKTWREGVIISLDINDGCHASCDFIPCIVEDSSVKVARGSKADEILSTFMDRSAKATSEEFIWQEFRKMVERRSNSYILELNFRNPYIVKFLEKLSVGRIMLGKRRKNKYLDYLICDSHREILRLMLSNNSNPSGREI